ncbi:MAG: hypothetical protein AAGA71_17260 [Pseudomonadota bacterium]
MGLFKALREAGLKLSTRDYLDALLALSLLDRPFETFDKLALTSDDTANEGGIIGYSRVRERKEIAWFLCLLFARSEPERRLIQTVVSRILPPAAPIQTLRLHRLITHGAPFSGSSPRDPLPSNPDLDRQAKAEKQKATDERKGAAKEAADTPAKSKNEDHAEPEPGTQTANVDLGRDGNLPLPRLEETSTLGLSPYSFEPATSFTYSWLLNTWRQFYIPQTSPGWGEIDFNRTVELAAQTGRVVAPVFRRKRQNAARLLFLVDLSFATTPWKTVREALLETYDREAWRFESTRRFFFRTAPSPQVYGRRDLGQPIDFEDVLAIAPDIPILIWGEAGAVQKPSRRLATAFEGFVETLAYKAYGPIVWINPAPERNWGGSMMDILADVPNLRAMELGQESLMEAMDHLRGQL